jgi:hypothetical protein
MEVRLSADPIRVRVFSGNSCDNLSTVMAPWSADEDALKQHAVGTTGINDGIMLLLARLRVRV